MGQLLEVNPKTIWRDEPQFSHWLKENVNMLGVELGLDLEAIKTEAPVGGFSADLLAATSAGNESVIIENQWGLTDHKHLGQLLTYASFYNAAHIIWVCQELNEQHRATLDWLNNNTSPDRRFYGVLVRAWKINDSPPAIVFDAVVRPNDFQKEGAQESRSALIAADQPVLNDLFRTVHADLIGRKTFDRLLEPLGYGRTYTAERTHRHVEYEIAVGRDLLRVNVWFNFKQPLVNQKLTDRIHSRPFGMIVPDYDVKFDELPGRRRQGLYVERIIDRGALSQNVADLGQWAANVLTELRRIVEDGVIADIEAAQIEVDDHEPINGDGE